MNCSGCVNCTNGQACREMYAALKEITKGAGPFSCDPLTHASNTIEAMKTLANAALPKAEGR